MLYPLVGTCKHLGTDPFAYLQETLPGLFALFRAKSAAGGVGRDSTGGGVTNGSLNVSA